MRRTKGRPREDDPIYISYKSKIQHYGNILPAPNLDNIKPVYDNSSWYSNKTFNFNQNDIRDINYDFSLDNSINNEIKFKTQKIRCYPTKFQIDILTKWFDADKLLYNHTVCFIRKQLPYMLVQTYKKVNREKKYFFVCDKKIKTLNLDKNKLENNKKRSIATLNKKLEIKNKKKKQHDSIIDIKKHISGIKKEIIKINKEITKFVEKRSKNESSIPTFDRLDGLIKEYTNFKKLRSNYLKDIRDEIYNKYKQYNIPAHSLDASIKRACTSYKSGITNLLENNTKRFRVRCTNKKNIKGIIEMEKQTFLKNKINKENYDICTNTLNEMNYKYDNKEYKITNPSTSSFYFDGNKYWLLYSKKVIKINNLEKKPYIALDPGIRCYQTGFTNDSSIDFGFDVYKKLEIYLNKIDKLNKNYTIENEISKCKDTIERHENIIYFLQNKQKHEKTTKHLNKLISLVDMNENRIERLNEIKTNKKEKNKYEKYLNVRKKTKSKFYYDKIKRKINEFHWKTAHNLATNYEIVIIGKMSMKSICEQEDFPDMPKRVGTLMRHYDFRSKLVYKCLSYGTKILVSNEKYTTKMCSLCGHYNETIKGEKVIHCNGCNKKYPRDIFSARGIAIKNLKLD